METDFLNTKNKLIFIPFIPKKKLAYIWLNGDSYTPLSFGDFPSVNKKSHSSSSTRRLD